MYFCSSCLDLNAGLQTMVLAQRIEASPQIQKVDSIPMQRRALGLNPQVQLGGYSRRPERRHLIKPAGLGIRSSSTCPGRRRTPHGSGRLSCRSAQRNCSARREAKKEAVKVSLMTKRLGKQCSAFSEFGALVLLPRILQKAVNLRKSARPVSLIHAC